MLTSFRDVCTTFDYSNSLVELFSFRKIGNSKYVTTYFIRCVVKPSFKKKLLGKEGMDVRESCYIDSLAIVKNVGLPF